MNLQAAHRLKTIQKVLAWALWGGNIAVIFLFWLQGSGQRMFAGDFAEAIVVLGFLWGMLATLGALTQFVLMSRANWLEPIFGLDRIALFHRLNGYATILLILAHPIFMVIGRSIQNKTDVFSQFLNLLEYPYVLWAFFAVLIFLGMIGTTIYIVRKRLKFETWYSVHFMVYAAILLMFWHQFANGQDILLNPVLYYYWIAIYLFAAANIVVWRFSLPVLRSFYFDFKVDKTQPATATATSVFIGGKNLERFRAKGGQFVMVRFLGKGFVFEEHPFSLSRLPNQEGLRLTIRQLGDFTNKIPTLKPGTRVIVSGPYGAFTHEKQVTNKVLYIAGGVGITPIRSMIEERANWEHPGNAALIYGNRTEPDTIFRDELTQLAQKIKMPLHNVLSDQKEYKGEKGYVDIEKIKRLVPDFAERDIFVCGPPPMMFGLIDALKAEGMPKEQIHYERFALHKTG